MPERVPREKKTKVISEQINGAMFEGISGEISQGTTGIILERILRGLPKKSPVLFSVVPPVRRISDFEERP